MVIMTTRRNECLKHYNEFIYLKYIAYYDTNDCVLAINVELFQFDTCCWVVVQEVNAIFGWIMLQELA